MSRAGLIDYYIKKSKEEGFEIDQVRKELEEKNVPDEEIRIITKLVDSELQKKALSTSYKNKSKEYIVAGIILTLVGFVVTFGTYLGIIEMGNSFLILYGPFIGGLSLILKGWVESKR